MLDSASTVKVSTCHCTKDLLWQCQSFQHFLPFTSIFQLSFRPISSWIQRSDRQRVSRNDTLRPKLWLLPGNSSWTVDRERLASTARSIGFDEWKAHGLPVASSGVLPLLRVSSWTSSRRSGTSCARAATPGSRRSGRSARRGQTCAGRLRLAGERAARRTAGRREQEVHSGESVGKKRDEGGTKKEAHDGRQRRGCGKEGNQEGSLLGRVENFGSKGDRNRIKKPGTRRRQEGSGVEWKTNAVDENDVDHAEDTTCLKWVRPRQPGVTGFAFDLVPRIQCHELRSWCLFMQKRLRMSESLAEQGSWT